jgi:hypothetical protein
MHGVGPAQLQPDRGAGAVKAGDVIAIVHFPRAQIAIEPIGSFAQRSLGHMARRR